MQHGQNKCQRNQIIYLIQARFVNEFEGKNGNQYMKLYFDTAKYEMEDSNIYYKIEILSHPKCVAGMQYDGKLYEVNADLPVPHKDCSLEVCGCTFSHVPQRDTDGKLIFR